jgi:hypothetical protein
MTRKKNINWHPIFKLVINRRVNDAIAFHIFYLPLSAHLKIMHMTNVEKWLNRIITIATMLLAILNYILAHLPKSMAILILAYGFSAQAQVKSTKFYPASKKEIRIVQENTYKKGRSAAINILKNDTIIYFVKDSSLYLSPSLSFNLFSRELKTNITTYGFLPGIGYGLKWNPYKWKSFYLVAIDLFANAGLSNNPAIPGNYFTLEAVPILTVFKYFHVGYGYRWQLAIDSNPSYYTSILDFGLSLPLQ